MDCACFDRKLFDHVAGTLDAHDAQAMQAHAQACPACAALADDTRALRTTLGRLDAPSPTPGFARGALRRARQANGAPSFDRRRDVRFALSGAMVACLAFLVSAALPTLTDRGESLGSSAQRALVATAETVMLPAGHIEPVRLRIDAPRDLEDVRFSIELPDRVTLADEPGIHALVWDGSLRKGLNMLELPLVAEDGAAGMMITRVSWGDFQRHLQTHLIAGPGPRDGDKAAAWQS